MNNYSVSFRIPVFFPELGQTYFNGSALSEDYFHKGQTVWVKTGFCVFEAEVIESLPTKRTPEEFKWKLVDGPSEDFA